MVKKEKFEGEEAFKCEECGMHYQEKDLAEKCERYCREKGMCNSEITEKSLERP
ncbi:MAG: hypothetical protein ABEK04_03760 [Candidatus Nanohalobium sp.]